MIDYLYDVMLVLLGDEDGVGPENHKEEKDAGHDEEDVGVIAFVVLEVAAELVLWIYQCQDRPSIDGEQNPKKSHKHACNLMAIDSLPIYKIVEHTHENRPKSRNRMHDIQRQIDLRPAKHERMHSKDEASDEEYCEFKGGAELELIAFDFAEGVGDDGLHDVAGELGFDEGHVVLVAIDEAGYPEEIGDADHDEGEVVIGDEAEGAALESDFAGHYQSCFKSYPTLSHQKTQFLRFCSLLPNQIQDFAPHANFKQVCDCILQILFFPLRQSKSQKQPRK